MLGKKCLLSTKVKTTTTTKQVPLTFWPSERPSGFRISKIKGRGRHAMTKKACLLSCIRWQFYPRDLDHAHPAGSDRMSGNHQEAGSLIHPRARVYAVWGFLDDNQHFELHPQLLPKMDLCKDTLDHGSNLLLEQETGVQKDFQIAHQLSRSRKLWNPQLLCLAKIESEFIPWHPNLPSL